MPGPVSTNTRPGVWLTDASLVLMALIWGVNFSVVKYGTSLVDPRAYNAARVGLAAVTLVIIVAVGRLELPSRSDIVALLGLGFLGNGIYQFFFVEGIARTSASNTALVVAASPALIAMIGRARGVERRDWLDRAEIGVKVQTLADPEQALLGARVVGEESGVVDGGPPGARDLITYTKPMRTDVRAFLVASSGERAAHYVRQLIFDGELRPGDRDVQRKLDAAVRSKP